MSILQQNNIININGEKIQFNNSIQTILEFATCCVILLFDNDIPENNVMCIDYSGNIVWNISQIIKLNYAESYISLCKETDALFSVISYNGVKFTIDILSNKVIKKSTTK